MPKEQKEHRYSDRQRSFDEDLEETMSSFAGGTETTDAPAESKTASEGSALDRLVWTASDEVRSIADASADATKVAADIQAVEVREKLRKMASARPAFVQGFLDESEKTAISNKWIGDRLAAASKDVPAAAGGKLSPMHARAILAMAKFTGGKKGRNEVARGAANIIRSARGVTTKA